MAAGLSPWLIRAVLHSLAGSSARWQAQLDHLRPADGDFEIASQAVDVATMADALGLGRFVLVGHNLRGGIALSFAGVAGDLRLWPPRERPGSFWGVRSTVRRNSEIREARN